MSEKLAVFLFCAIAAGSVLGVTIFMASLYAEEGLCAYPLECSESQTSTVSNSIAPEPECVEWIGDYNVTGEVDKGRVGCEVTCYFDDDIMEITYCTCATEGR